MLFTGGVYLSISSSLPLVTLILLMKDSANLSASSSSKLDSGSGLHFLKPVNAVILV